MIYKRLNILLTIILPIIVPFLFVLGLVVIQNNLNDYMIIEYSTLFTNIIQILFDKEILIFFIATFTLAVKGLFIGLSISVFFVIIFCITPKASHFWLNILNSIRAFPLTLLIPFLLILPVVPMPGLLSTINFTSGDRDPSYLIALGTLIYVLIGVAEGIEKRNKIREHMYLKIMKISRLKYFLKIQFFEITPFVMGMLRIVMIHSLILAIVFEMIIEYPGIGQELANLSQYWSYDLPSLYTSFAIFYWVGFMGTTLDLVFQIFRKKVIFWEKLIIK